MPQDAVLGHAKGLASKAGEHYNKRMYKSLQSNLVAMKALQAKFSAVDAELDQLQHVWEELHKKIREYVKEVREEAVQKLKEGSGSGSSGCCEVEGFANNLITLGLLAFEIPTFKGDILEQMNELMNNARRDCGGIQYILKLGPFLMQHSDAGDSVDDGTMSRPAAAKRIASEFKQFQNVQNMFWNQAVQKMQKSPGTCVEEMGAKTILDDQDATMDRDDLKEGLTSFWDHYDHLLNQTLEGAIQLNNVVSQCLQEVAALRKNHAATGGTLDPLLIKESIPQLLGGTSGFDSAKSRRLRSIGFAWFCHDFVVLVNRGYRLINLIRI